jgi:cytochrome P450 family 110
MKLPFLFPEISKQTPMPRVLPAGPTLSLPQAWLLVQQPRAFGERLRQRFGGMVALSTRAGTAHSVLGSDALVVVLSSAGARQVFSADPDGYDALWKEGFTGVAGRGSLWVLGGDEHRHERQLHSPAFHSQAFRGFGETIREMASRQTAEWQPGQTLRALDTTLAISLEIILRLVFGAEHDQFDEGRRVLRRLWSTMHPLIVFFPRLQRPWFPLWRRYARARDDFSSWVWSLIAARRARPALGDDILGRMLVARDENGNPMADEAIRDELITILLAGHETTATALAWALYDLARNPLELERLRAELDSFGPHPPAELLVKAPLLTAVCNETLRLHTLLAEVGRVLVAPLELLGYTIPAGNSVIISIIAIHHDPRLYPEPDRYIPDRFMQRAFAPYEFLPFGGGHRRCLGAALSDYEMRVALAEIVSHWDFEAVDEEQEIRHDIAMGPKHGVRLRITGRRMPTVLSSAGQSMHERVSDPADLALEGV